MLNRPNAHGVLTRAEAGAVLSDLRDEAAELKAILEDATSPACAAKFDVRGWADR